MNLIEILLDFFTIFNFKKMEIEKCIGEILNINNKNQVNEKEINDLNQFI